MKKSGRGKTWVGKARRLVYLLLFCSLAGGVLPAQAHDIVWRRHLQGYLDGVYLGFYHGGLDYSKPVLADLDGDGDGDLYVGEHDGYLDYFENLGGNPPNWYCVTTALDSIDVGKHCAPAFWDLDVDGDLDLFMGCEDGNIWFYRNTGTPTSPQFTFVTENYGMISVDHHSTPFFRDVNNNGTDDLLIGQNNGGATYFMNMGQPGAPLWSNQGAYQGWTIGPKSSVCIFDVNGDNLQDIFMGELEGYTTYFRNDGPDTLPSYMDLGSIYDVGHNSVPTFWDINGDGLLDLITGTADGNLDLLTNVGATTIPRWELTQDNLGYFDAGRFSNPTLTDIDGDSDLDLFIGHLPPSISFLENVGTVDSAAWQLVTENYHDINLSEQEAPAFADIDADGDLDLFVGSGDGTITFYQNVGTPQQPVWFHPVYQYTGIDVGTYSTPALADVDTDHDLDLFIGCYNGTLRYLRNDGDSLSAVWTDLSYYPGIDVGYYSAPAFMDLDEDGDLDLLLGSGFLTGTISLYRNNGNPLLPAWSLETAYFEGWDFGDNSIPCLGDLNGDGRLDLLIGCQSGGVYLLENISSELEVQITLLPYAPPIVLPWTGGSVEYVIQINNNEPQPMSLTAWTTLTMPNGQTINPLDSISLSFPPGVFNQNDTLQIPAIYPSGIYTVRGYLGNYPDLFFSSDTFQFVKEDSVSPVNPEYPQAGPVAFQINGLFPNPFNNSTKIEYTLTVPGEVEIGIFDLTGRWITNLLQSRQSAGIHQLTFEPQNLAGGIYFLRLQTAGQVVVRKLCYVK